MIKLSIETANVTYVQGMYVVQLSLNALTLYFDSMFLNFRNYYAFGNIVHQNYVHRKYLSIIITFMEIFVKHHNRYENIWLAYLCT